MGYEGTLSTSGDTFVVDAPLAPIRVTPPGGRSATKLELHPLNNDS